MLVRRTCLLFFGLLAIRERSQVMSAAERVRLRVITADTLLQNCEKKTEIADEWGGGQNSKDFADIIC